MQFETLTLTYFSPTDATSKVLHAIAKGMDVEIIETISLTHPRERATPRSSKGEHCRCCHIWLSQWQSDLEKRSQSRAAVDHGHLVQVRFFAERMIH